MDYRPGLNQRSALEERFAEAASGADRTDIAVAYAKSTGVMRLLGTEGPRKGRIIVGLGFGLTDPPAIEQLDNAGYEVRVAADSDALQASAFHPKLYLVSRRDELIAISGSANLTGAGWRTNVEQFEELHIPDPSDAADDQRGRFEQIWAFGRSLEDFHRSGDWTRYLREAADRRKLERADRRRLIRVRARNGQMIGSLLRPDTRAAPAYMAITNRDWWHQQLAQRDETDVAMFWRRNTNAFRALAPGGLMLHVVKNEGVPAGDRLVEGFSLFNGDYMVGDARQLWLRYGRLLGVASLPELYNRLALQPGAGIGVICLEQVTEFEQPVRLADLATAGVEFQPNIVSGRRLDVMEVSVVLELAGWGVGNQFTMAAEPESFYEQG